MLNATYFLSVHSEVITTESISIPLVGTLLGASQLVFTITIPNSYKHESLSITTFHEQWQRETKTNITTDCTKEIKLEICADQQDLHFEIAFSKGRKSILLSGCVQITKLTTQPVFVVGSPRSGTSIISQAIMKTLELNSKGETHILTAFNKVDRLLHDNFYSTKQSNISSISLSSFPHSYAQAQLLNLVRTAYHSTFSHGLFIDKTPGKLMLAMLPIALIAFPNAKVIFCKRRGIENVLSRVKKFKGMTFEQHLNGWVACFDEWKKTKEEMSLKLASNSWQIEIDQYDILMQPNEVAATICQLLKLDDKCAKHISSILKMETPEQSSTNIKEIVNFDNVEWDESQKSLFIEVCSCMMERQGYSFNETYYLRKN